jgi:hypothetical protein
VSVGGIETADDAWERILAGATLVQAYTGFVYGGPYWPRRMNRELARRVHASGASSVQTMVGAAAAGNVARTDSSCDGSTAIASTRVLTVVRTSTTRT